MKITMKPLKGNSFEVEAEGEQKVEDLKKIVATAASEFPADQQKLIYSGRILKDDELVKDIGIKEGQFIVVMVATPAPAPGRGAAFPAMTGGGGGGGGAAGAGRLPPVLANLRNSPQFTQYAQMVANNPQALEQMLGVIAQTNPEVVQAINENQEAFMQMLQEAAGGGGGGGGAPADPVAAMLAGQAQNPAMLQQLLPQIEQANPELAAAIRENPQALVQMLAEAGAAGGGGAGGMPPGGPGGPTVIQLTEEESAAVGRLVALGFDRQTAAQAYLACDKNEEVAANFLFENGDADMD